MFNTDRLNAFNPPPLSGWSCLTPAFPNSPRLILPVHPSACLTPASCKTTAMCRKCWIFCGGQQRARSCTASLVPLFQTYTEKGTTQNISFLSKELWASSHAWMMAEPSGSCQCSSRQPSSRWPPLHTLTYSSVQVIVHKIFEVWSNEHQSVQQWRELQFIYRGCTHTFTVLSDVHAWSPALLHWSHHFPGTDTYFFFTPAEGITYYIYSALGYNKEEKMRHKRV